MAVHLWKYTAKYKVENNIEKTMKCRRQRVNDKYIMDETLIEDFTNQQQTAINICRMYMKDLFISDILMMDGKMVNRKYYSQRCQIPSRYEWPQISHPYRKYWNIWFLYIDSIC